MKQYLLLLFLIIMISGCGLMAESDTDAAATQQQAESEVVMHQVDVVNQLDQVVSRLKYKPCGDSKELYTLAENLKPKQRVTVNVHEACVTIKALNAFNDEMKQIVDLQLSKNNKWEIK